MFRSIIIFNTPLILSMNIICEWLLLFVGHRRSHVASNHVKLICVRYFDDMYVVIPLVFSCEHRLHGTSPSLSLREFIVY